MYFFLLLLGRNNDTVSYRKWRHLLFSSRCFPELNFYTVMNQQIEGIWLRHTGWGTSLQVSLWVIGYKTPNSRFLCALHSPPPSLLHFHNWMLLHSTGKSCKYFTSHFNTRKINELYEKSIFLVFLIKCNEWTLSLRLVLETLQGNTTGKIVVIKTDITPKRTTLLSLHFQGGNYRNWTRVLMISAQIWQPSGQWSDHI